METITLKDLERQYLEPIKFKRDIEKYISTSKVQGLIRKAMKGALTDKDNSNVYKIGKKGGLMPNLYWLLFIYIHPLTTTAYICKKIW